MKYQIEHWLAIEPEVLAIAGAHWDEIALDQDRIPLDIDCELYRQLDDAGGLVIITAREDGNLVGYHAAIVRTHPHYKSTMFGVLDCYFLLPDFRRGSAGVALFTRMEEELKARGVKSMLWTSKKHFDLRRLFAHLAWEPVGEIYQKWIGD